MSVARQILCGTLFALLAAGAHATEADAPGNPSGQFKAAFSSFTGSPSLAGKWRVVARGDTLALELQDDFKARSGPDLKLFLSPKDPGQVTGKNATQGSLSLGLLQSNQGQQRYEIPAGTDLSAFRSVIVHCEQYSKLWGTGALR